MSIQAKSISWWRE